MFNSISLTEWKNQFASKPFIESDSGTYTYSAAADYISKIAQCIKLLLPDDQDVVPVLLPNSPEFILTVLGVMAAEKIPYPIPPTCKPTEYRTKTSGLHLKAAICNGINKELIAAAGLKPITLDVLQQHLSHLRYSDAFSQISGEAKLMCATSGTTGTPKRPVLQVARMLANATAHAQSLGLKADDRILGCSPFHHVFILSTHLFSVIALKATLVVGQDPFPQTISRMIQQYQVTYTNFVPAILDAIVRNFEYELFDAKSLRKVSVGAAPVSVKQIKRYRQFFTNQQLYVTYGLTEAGPRVSTLDVNHTPEYLWDTVGLPLANTAARIARPNANGIGELQVKASWQMLGYHQDDRANAEVWQDGWLSTGDLATLSPDGFIRLRGRQKDLIISGGVNISPAEIETMLNRISWVAEAAVLPVPDRKRGEVPHAFVVREGNGTETEILSILRSQLDQIKVPKKVHFVDAIPKNATGKADRLALLESYLNHRLSAEESILSA